MTSLGSTRAERRRVVVIGGGVIGCAILDRFAALGIDALMIEAARDVGEGASKANSAIVHTGFDSRSGSIESRMLSEASRLWPAELDRLAVPFLRVGAIMVARTEDESVRLRGEVAPAAVRRGVAVELLDRTALRGRAPFLADDVIAGLSIPGEAVIDPFWLTRAFAGSAVDAGAELRLGVAVTGCEPGPSAILVRLADGGTVLADQVVDAAGMWADDVARMGGDASFNVTPRKGQFLISEETFGVDTIVLPIPGERGKGMLVTPIIFGGLLLGPTATDQVDKHDRSVDAEARAAILEACSTLVPAVTKMIPIRQFAGVRHVSSTGDFILRPSAVSDRLYLAAGMRSTGVSTSPAVARHVVGEVMSLRGWSAGKPSRPRSIRSTLSDEQGGVVCLCRSISRSELDLASGSTIQPRTLDALKRRCGVTFGDCQGNLCAVEVAAALASRLGVPIASVEKHEPGSWLWRRTPSATGDSPASIRIPSGPPHSSAWDSIVIGGGAAGRAVANALAAAGGRVLGIERRIPPDGGGDRFRWLTGWTVVGLEQRPDDRWRVLAQSTDGQATLDATTVVIATGGYLEPREHRAISGPRPAGIMTGDLAWRILDEGLVPGDRVALLGSGPSADRLARALGEAGSRVDRLPSGPTGVIGQARLEGVVVEGRQHKADTLVLADRRLPLTFLLRDLGIVDGRPGRPAPVDSAGRLSLAGLWAVGCCVEPDLDHDDCARRGRDVGLRIVAEVAAGQVLRT